MSSIYSEPVVFSSREALIAEVARVILTARGLGCHESTRALRSMVSVRDISNHEVVRLIWAEVNQVTTDLNTDFSVKEQEEAFLREVVL